MKLIYGALIFVLCFSGGCFAQDKALLIDDFEIAVSAGPEGTVDSGAGNGSSLTVSAETKLFHTGKQSLKLDYNAVKGGYMYAARGFGLDAKNTAWLISPEKIEWKNYKATSFYMYGANSKTQIAFDVKDNGNEIWRTLITDDFTGWKQVICPFTDFFPRGDWQPDASDKNANLDFPLKSFQFEPLPEAKGTVYFDTVELIKS